MAGDEQRGEEIRSDPYKIKKVSFFDRTVPIILQNDNGPSLLLAICNIMLLRNNWNLNVDVSEITQQRLLRLVGEWLLDVKSNTKNINDGYVKNQLQNISDAIDLVPSLATGIDVNIRFRNINDFESVPVCSIFDLLDIGLVHGWIVDPRDTDTATAIGSSSYSALLEKLVSLEASKGGNDRHPQEDYVDFVAATTATLGVPSPCLARMRSFDDPPNCHFCSSKQKSDTEEVEQLMKVLELSKADNLNSFCLSSDTKAHPSVAGTSEGACILSSRIPGISNLVEEHNNVKHGRPFESGGSKHEYCTTLPAAVGSVFSSYEASVSLPKKAYNNYMEKELAKPSGCRLATGCLEENVLSNQVEKFRFCDGSDIFPSGNIYESFRYGLKWDQNFLQADSQDSSTSYMEKTETNDFPFNRVANQSSYFLVANGEHGIVDVPLDANSSLDGSEPIYEGEDFVQDLALAMHENDEPVYEGELLLAEQSDKEREGGCGSVPYEGTQPQCLEPMSPAAREGELIRNFLTNNASQLTIYGLICLRKYLKEHSLCLFFRNNNFSTMFKHEGQLYLLTTDQSYFNQPDLVWEKLNEVNGDTVFMTGKFEEFKEYLASVDKAAVTDSTEKILEFNPVLGRTTTHKDFEGSRG